MGYIKNVKLVAYLTQAGRKYIASGQNKKIVIPYFALSDPDVNYNIASKKIINTQDSNLLPINFIPDLSGDRKNCIYSIANGIEQRYTVEGGDCNTVGSYIGLDGEIGCTYTALTGTYPTVQFVRNIGGVNKVIYDYDISDNNVVSFLSNGLDIPIQLSIKPLGYESVDLFINYENIQSSYVNLENNQNPINIDFVRNSDGIVYKKLNFSNLSVLQFGRIYNFNLTLNNPINSIIGKINQIQFSLYKYGFIAFDRGTLKDPITYELVGGQGEISDKIRLGVYDGNGNKISGINDSTSVSMILDLPNGVTGFLLNQGNNNGLTLSNVNINQDVIISYNNVNLPNETPLRVRLILNQNTNFKLGKPSSFNLKVKSKSLVKNSVSMEIISSTQVATQDALKIEIINNKLIELTILDFTKLGDNNKDDNNGSNNVLIEFIYDKISNDFANTESFEIKNILTDNLSFKNFSDRVDFTSNLGGDSLPIEDFVLANFKTERTEDNKFSYLYSMNLKYSLRNIPQFEYGIYEHTLKLVDVVDLNVINDSVTVRFIYNKLEEEEVIIEKPPIAVNYELPNPYIVKVKNVFILNDLITYSNGTKKNVTLISINDKIDNTLFGDITYKLGSQTITETIEYSKFTLESANGFAVKNGKNIVLSS